MPRAFSVQEEASIRELLRNVARRLFASQGVLKTSLEQITSAAGIAKGSFYKFYQTKEVLFFELLEDSQTQIREPLLVGNLPTHQKTRRHFEKRVRTLFDQICADPLVQYMGREQELLAIVRKTPPKILSAHQKEDQAFLDALIKRWNTKSKPPIRDVVAARVSVLLLVSLKRDFLGERLFPHAATSAIESLTDCFF